MDILTFLRSFRIGPFAIFDFSISFLFVYLIAPLLRKMGLKLSLTQLFWFTIPGSILIHILFGAMTPLTKMFLDPYGSYWIKILFLFMVVMGVVSKTQAKKK